MATYQHKAIGAEFPYNAPYVKDHLMSQAEMLSDSNGWSGKFTGCGGELYVYDSSYNSSVTGHYRKVRNLLSGTDFPTDPFVDMWFYISVSSATISKGLYRYDGSNWVKFKAGIDGGTELPTNPTENDWYYLTTATSTNKVGLYRYNGTAWELYTKGISDCTEFPTGATGDWVYLTAQLTVGDVTYKVGLYRYDGTAWKIYKGGIDGGDTLPTTASENDWFYLNQEQTVGSVVYSIGLYRHNGTEWKKFESGQSQVATIPEAKLDNKGKVVQFIGTATTTYRWASKPYTSGSDASKTSTGYYKATDTNKWYKDGTDITSDVTECTELPTADSSLVNKYKFNTTDTKLNLCESTSFVHGYFYECVEDTTTTPTSYKWINIAVQPSSDSEVTDLSNTVQNETWNKANINFTRCKWKCLGGISFVSIFGTLKTAITDVKSSRSQILTAPATSLPTGCDLPSKLSVKITEPTGYVTCNNNKKEFFDSTGSKYINPTAVNGKEYLVSKSMSVISNALDPDTLQPILIVSQNHDTAGNRIFTSDGKPICGYSPSLTIKVGATDNPKLYALKYVEGTGYTYRNKYVTADETEIEGDFYECVEVANPINSTYIYNAAVASQQIKYAGSFQVDSDGYLGTYNIIPNPVNVSLGISSANPATVWDNGVCGTVEFTKKQCKGITTQVTANVNQTSGVMTIDGTDLISSYELVLGMV